MRDLSLLGAIRALQAVTAAVNVTMSYESN